MTVMPAAPTAHKGAQEQCASARLAEIRGRLESLRGSAQVDSTVENFVAGALSPSGGNADRTAPTSPAVPLFYSPGAIQRDPLEGAACSLRLCVPLECS